MTGRETHSHVVSGGRGHWWTDRLWAASADLPVQTVPIDSIAEFDLDCWFHGRGPTCREVAEPARRINAADLTYPVILAADGSLMDGGHRIAKAYLLGEQHVQARRFVTDPTPDWIVPHEAT
ncbi:MAG: chromosome partitioning protein ParB [Acidimicrobiia bacterium]